MKRILLAISFVITINLYSQTLTLDNSFGTNGISIFTNETDRGGIKSIIQTDGKIIVAGTRINGANLNEVFVARLNENGTVDTTFGNNGFFTSYQETNVGTPNLFMIGNKILIYYPANKKIIKINSNGTFDTTFGTNGITNIISNDWGSPENAALIDNYLYIRSSNSNIGAYNILQKVDVATGIVASTTNVIGINKIADVFNGPNNKLLLKSFDGQNCRIYLVNTDGTVDNSFGLNGSIIISTFISNNAYDSSDEYVVLDGDNNIIHTLIDFPTATTTVKKYNPNGSLISTFANIGNFQMLNTYIFDVKIFSNEIYLSGASFNNGTYNLLLAKLTENGILDNSFNNNGIFIYDSNIYQESSSSLNIISASSFLVAGQMIINSPNKSIYTAKFNLQNTITAPILNSNEINDESYVNTYSANPIGFSIGTNGANQTWDYSNILLTSVGTSTETIVTVAPFITNFPSSNYIIKSTSSGTDYFKFYLLTSSKLELLGITSSTNIIADFSPNAISQFEFPFTYNLLVNDTYSTIGSPSANNPFSIKYDAFGTLITPFGTFSNVIRTKKIDGIYPEYTWYSQNSNKAILKVIFNSNGISSATFNEYTNLGITAYENNKILIYPNPALEYYTVQNTEKLTENIQCKIIDMIGRTIKTENTTYNQIINIAEITAGNYIINVKEENGNTYQKKLIKN